jgi:curved DNA-binding protein
MAGTPTEKDPYAILGVARDADADAIKKAYRKLAQKYHPDRNPDDASAEDRFKQVSQAYSVLSDPERRASYDEFGAVALDPNFDAEQARRFGGFRQGGGGFGGFDPGDMGTGGLGSLFENLFGGGGHGPQTPRPRAGANLESDFELDFLEAARGSSRRITVNRPQPDGSSRTDTLTVQIPAGIADGGRIRLSGKGSRGTHGGPAGNLYVTVRVRSHPVFRREGQDLHMDVAVSVSEAILGADIEIPTLDGRVTLHVPPETDSGARLRLKSKGFPPAGSKAAGDLYVTVLIRVPKDLNDAQKEQFEKLAHLDPKDLRRDLER